MPRTIQARAVLGGTLLLAASCHRPAPDTPPAAEAARPLAVFATQKLTVTPTQRVRPDSLGWVQQLGGFRVAARRLDTAIVAVLDERGLAARWILTPDLMRSYERNRTYAADPYQLVVEQLRLPSFKAGQKYGEPLATQLRTMIALHEDARYVMVPVELRFEREAGATSSVGRAVLRTAILDPRYTEARFVADIRGDTSSAPARALATAASRLVDLFVAP